MTSGLWISDQSVSESFRSYSSFQDLAYSPSSSQSSSSELERPRYATTLLSASLNSVTKNLWTSVRRLSTWTLYTNQERVSHHRTSQNARFCFRDKWTSDWSPVRFSLIVEQLFIVQVTQWVSECQVRDMWQTTEAWPRLDYPKCSSWTSTSRSCRSFGRRRRNCKVRVKSSTLKNSLISHACTWRKLLTDT